MRFPVKPGDNDEIDEEQALEMIDYAIKNGVTYFDTAYPYHKGMSETFIGSALKRYPRDSFNLATKMPMWSIENQDQAKQIFAEQLQKCQVAYFDFYLVHNMNRENYRRAIEYGIIELLQEYKRQGLIHHLGFSFHDSVELLESHLDAHPWDFVQLQINYLDWELQNAKKSYQLAVDRNIPVIIMEPVRGGALANLSEPANEVLQTFNPEMSIASWAIRYAASKTGVMTVLSGMSNFEQVKDNIATLSNFTPLNQEEEAVLSEALKIYLSSGTIPCTGCRYCMDCPFGVDIPRVFSIYNQYMLNKNKMSFMSSYFRVLEESKRAENCTACATCMKKCPQFINIPEWMEKIDELARTLQNE
ncbi:MAG: aldo/keto reductase [Bacilli bacterium]|nr:aldo/keto reductase [Bacilli bacterium]MBN2696751.1 aldo/keto reductase [Bacilli bacterium]